MYTTTYYDTSSVLRVPYRVRNDRVLIEPQLL